MDGRPAWFWPELADPFKLIELLLLLGAMVALLDKGFDANISKLFLLALCKNGLSLGLTFAFKKGFTEATGGAGAGAARGAVSSFFSSEVGINAKLLLPCFSSNLLTAASFTKLGYWPGAKRPPD